MMFILMNVNIKWIHRLFLPLPPSFLVSSTMISLARSIPSVLPLRKRRLNRFQKRRMVRNVIMQSSCLKHVWLEMSDHDRRRSVRMAVVHPRIFTASVWKLIKLSCTLGSNYIGYNGRLIKLLNLQHPETLTREWESSLRWLLIPLQFCPSLSMWVRYQSITRRIWSGSNNKCTWGGHIWSSFTREEDDFLERSPSFSGQVCTTSEAHECTGKGKHSIFLNNNYSNIQIKAKKAAEAAAKMRRNPELEDKMSDIKRLVDNKSLSLIFKWALLFDK